MVWDGRKEGVKVVKRERLCLGRLRAQELCESRGGRPGLPSLISLRFLWTLSNTELNLVDLVRGKDRG